MTFLELDELTAEERTLRDELHRVALEVLRPAARALDRMDPEERVAPGSPYHEAMRTLRRLGYHRIFLPPEYGGPDPPLGPLGRAIVFEELAWGSLGLATAFGVDMLPFVLISNFGGDELRRELLAPWAEDRELAYHGCWGVTEPAHGSDAISFLRDEGAASFGPGQVIAEADGDGWVIRGQKAAWVSSAPVATHCAVHAQVRDGGDFLHGLLAVVPLDSPGVRRGRPVDMLGTRDDPQGEIFFDGVRIPERYVVVAPTPFYGVFVDQLLCLTSVGIGAMAVGVARAAFEEALTYARERVQGGGPITRHKNIQLTLYSMFEKVETARAYTRGAMRHVYRRALEEATYDASPRHARAAQIYAKRVAFEVAHDAVQVHGAMGLSKESLVEKLFRDARSLLIEDGTLEVLSLDAAHDVIASYESERYELSEVMAKW
ncbi:MAG: acyl-CoA dehydrogenase family protein [Actinomycetota bacterium]